MPWQSLTRRRGGAKPGRILRNLRASASAPKRSAGGSPPNLFACPHSFVLPTAAAGAPDRSQPQWSGRFDKRMGTDEWMSRF